MRSTRNGRYRVQIIILIAIISLFVISQYVQRKSNVENHVENIEENHIPVKKIVLTEDISPSKNASSLSSSSSSSSDSTNCAYKVLLRENKNNSIVNLYLELSKTSR